MSSIVATARRLPIVWLLVAMVVIVCAVFAERVAPYPYYLQTAQHRLSPPFWMSGGDTEFLLGTDLLGRDTLSRLIFGARFSLLVTLTGLALAGVIGVALGVVAAYYGGWTDALIMRGCDVLLSFPAVLLALLFAVINGPSLTNIIIIIAIVLWGRYARLVRGEALSLKERDFVVYARVIGTPAIFVMFRHILPNLLPSVLVLASYLAGYVIILEASLSFLGAGVPPPEPSWGAMVSDGKDFISSSWWVSFFPGVTIVITCLALNQLGDWLRDHLDPKLRQI